MSLEVLTAEARRAFAQRFGRPAQLLVAAPGRVNVIGEHIDYNEGFVLPMAIERYTVIAADRARRSDGQTVGGEGAPCIQLHSMAAAGTVEIPLSGPIERGTPAWANYPRGVIAGMQRRGRVMESFDALIVSNVPLGGGLSSSAALEVATATLIEALTGKPLDPGEKALLCQQAEQEFAGVPCGIMDQFTSACARENHLLLLDCRSRRAQMVPMTDPRVAILIINTNVRHQLGDGEYAKRRSQCEAAAAALGLGSLRDATLEALTSAEGTMDPLIFLRARHVITEMRRTVDAAEAIADGDWEKLGALMYASHESLRDDFEVSCRELDLIVDLAREIGEPGGVYGCRMTGGGFGGCTVSLVRTNAVPQIVRCLTNAYQNKTGIEPAWFVSRPAGGAKVLP